MIISNTHQISYRHKYKFFKAKNVKNKIAQNENMNNVATINISSNNCPPKIPHKTKNCSTIW